MSDYVIISIVVVKIGQVDCIAVQNSIYFDCSYKWFKRTDRYELFCVQNSMKGGETMADIFEGIKNRRFGIEIEMTGIDPTTIAAMVGHSTPQTTLTTYSHFFADSKRRASNIIADIIEGKTAS